MTVIANVYLVLSLAVELIVLCRHQVVAVDPRPQPGVPPTAIVQAPVVVITRLSVASIVGVVTTVVSEGVATAVSRVNDVSVRALAAFVAVSVKVIVQT